MNLDHKINQQPYHLHPETIQHNAALFFIHTNLSVANHRLVCLHKIKLSMTNMNADETEKMICNAKYIYLGCPQL